MEIINKQVPLKLYMMSISTFAITENEEDIKETNINKTIEGLRKQYPDAEILYENDIFHIYVPDNAMTQAAVQSIYAPDGGTWKGFVAP